MKPPHQPGSDAGDEPLRRNRPRPAAAKPEQSAPPAAKKSAAKRNSRTAAPRPRKQPAAAGAARPARASAPRLDVRTAAALTVAAVLDGGSSLSSELPRQAARVAPRDRPLLAELAYGTLRFFPALDARLARLLDKPLAAGSANVRALLLLGLYQLEHLRVPDYAAVSSCVTAARARPDTAWAAGLINAVLRNSCRRAAELDAALASDPAAQQAHPAWLLERLQTDWPQAWPAIVAANNSHAPLTLRVNLTRGSRSEYLERLTAAGIAASAHPLVDSAVVLDNPCEVEALPGFAEGAVSVQDAAAQLAAVLLAAAPGERVLDACCAPGGKTGHLLEHTPGIELLAIDADAGRLGRVHENLARLGQSAEVRCADAGNPPAWWDGQPFQRILLDAPCSATGVIRRHPDIKALRTAADLDSLAQRQLALLDALWPLLARDGILIYATCSVMCSENEGTLNAFLATHADARAEPIRTEWGQPCGPGRQILPGEAGMDGFFYACLHKLP